MNFSFLIVFFIFFSSLLNFALCTCILFPNSVNIFATYALNSFLVSYLFLFHDLFFSEVFFFFFLVLSSESSFSAFSFCLIFSASMNLGETVAYCSFKGMFLYGNVPIETLCVCQCIWSES